MNAIAFIEKGKGVFHYLTLLFLNKYISLFILNNDTL